MSRYAEATTPTDSLAVGRATQAALARPKEVEATCRRHEGRGARSTISGPRERCSEVLLLRPKVGPGWVAVHAHLYITTLALPPEGRYPIEFDELVVPSIAMVAVTVDSRLESSLVLNREARSAITFVRFSSWIPSSRRYVTVESGPEQD